MIRDPLNAITRAITNLEKRLRRVETREDAMHGWENATLVNSWTNVGAPYANASHWMTRNNRIYLRGRITGGSIPSVAFTMPTDHKHRPSATYQFGNVTVNTSGEVSVISGSSPVSLDGIAWIAES